MKHSSHLSVFRFSSLVSYNRAFTLTEIIATVGIFTIIMVAVSAFEANVFSYQRSVSGSFTTVQDAETILKSINKDIRMASQGSDGSYALQTVATNTLTFFADTDGNGIKERIRYSINNNKLFKATLIPSGSPLTYTGSESTSTIMTNVRNSSSTPIFEYFNGNYEGTTTGALVQPVTTSAVRLIKVNITLDVDPNQSPLPRTYSTEVTLRNLKDNL